AAGIYDKIVKPCQFPGLSGLHVAKSRPAVFLHYFRDRHAGPFDYSRIHADIAHPQERGEEGSHHALARTPITDQDNIHDLSRSITTLRITSTGASTPVKCPNCRTAWFMNISTPEITLRPRDLASARSRVSSGVYTTSKTTCPGRKSPA